MNSKVKHNANLTLCIDKSRPDLCHLHIDEEFLPNAKLYITNIKVNSGNILPQCVMLLGGCEKKCTPFAVFFLHSTGFFIFDGRLKIRN